MKKHMLLIIVSVFLTGCKIADTYYDDDFEVNDPEVLSYTKLYPNIASLTVQQEVPSSIGLPPKQFNNAIVVARLGPTQSSNLEFMVKLFDQEPHQAKNLLLFKRVFVSTLNDHIDLGETYQVLLDEDHVDLRILDTGEDPADQVEERGYFIGTYSLSLAGHQVAVGHVEGYVEYNGIFQFEFSGFDDLRFFSGNGIHGEDDITFIVHASLHDTTGALVAPIDTSINFNGEHKTLGATLPIASANFDTLIFNLTKVQ